MSFESKTGAVWIDEMIVSNDAAHYPVNPSVQERKLSNQFEPHYAAYKEPKLALRGEKRYHYSLIADEKIEKNRIITEYLGQWNPNLPHSPYRFGPIESLHYRNYGAMIDDGFPNALPIYLYEVNNLPLRIIFVAIEDIERGEPICFHYGMRHSVKLNGHIEMRKEALISWMKSDTFDNHIKKAKEDEGALAKLQYLMQTPTALDLAIKRCLVDQNTLRTFFTKPDNLYYLLRFPFNPNPRESALHKAILSLLD